MAAAFTFAMTVFFLGAAAGLVSIWLQLGFLPVIIPATDIETSFKLYAGLSLQLLLSTMTVMAARSVTVKSWTFCRPPETSKEVQFLDNWFSGTPLMLFYAALVTPPMVCGLLIISPLMGIVGFAATGIAIKGMMGWSEMVGMLNDLHGQKAFVIKGWVSGLALACAAILLSIHNTNTVNRILVNISDEYDASLAQLGKELTAARSAEEKVIRLMTNRFTASKSGADSLIAEIELNQYKLTSAQRLSSIEHHYAVQKQKAKALRSLAPAIKPIQF